MSILASTTPAPTPKSKNIRTIATFYAAVLVVMSVAQLFSFTEFLKLFVIFNVVGGIRSAYFLAAFVVVAEVFALPFLLRMPLSTACRWLSMTSGWLVALIWASLSISLLFQETIVHNVGFLGVVVELMPGWWAVCISSVFGILAAWASWGMWPHGQSVKRQTSRHR